MEKRKILACLFAMAILEDVGIGKDKKKIGAVFGFEPTCSIVVYDSPR